MQKALWVFIFLFVAALSACGGSSQSPITTAVTATATPTGTVYSGHVQAIPPYSAGSPAPVSVSVLYSGFFPIYSNESLVTVTLSPAPSFSPTIVWTSTNQIFPTGQTPSLGGGSAVPAGSIWVGLPSSLSLPISGVAIANLEPPLNGTATIPVAAYKGTLLGCDLRGTPAVAATTSGALVSVNSIGAADFYTTTTFGQGTLCSGGPQPSPAPTGAPIYNIPYGGVVITGDIASFAYVTTAQWQPTMTSWLPSPNATLLFKTSTGAFVKYYFQGTAVFGPYEVSQNGTFINVPSPSPT